MKNYKVIWKTEIRVVGELRQPGEVFVAEQKLQEIKNLTTHKFIEVTDESV